MILFPELGRYGRLGNQMFQIAASLAVAYKNDTEFYYPHDIDERIHDGQKCLLKNFVNNIKKLPQLSSPQETHVHYTQTENQDIDKGYFKLGDNSSLSGFFESEQYFEKYKEKIKSVFVFQDTIDLYANHYIEALKSLYTNTEIVGVHFRRGDYNEPKETPDLFFKFSQHAISESFKDKPYIFLIFSGGNKENSKEDIEYCKANFFTTSDSSLIFCELNDTIRELAIMTKCDHMILTTKSTLGWWGAYLNKNKDKKIIVPRECIGPKYKANILWPTEFTQI
jgi:hypothetical protein